MDQHWDRYLDRWTAASLIDNAAAGRIRQWENSHAPSPGLRRPALVALAFGGILLGAGVLLFVSAHWIELSPGERLFLVVATLAVLHAAGTAVTLRFPALSVTLHTLGTISLGGAIALTGQIFNLSEYWPTAILLWTIGAAAAWLLLRHWTQAALVAILFPCWLSAEWLWQASNQFVSGVPVCVGICALSFVYLAARRPPVDSPLRTALTWLGGIALLPACAVVATHRLWERSAGSWQTNAVAWIAALGIPLVVALLLDVRRAPWSSAALAWTVILALIAATPHESVAIYAWCVAGAVGLAFWGIREACPERVNLGVAGLGLTILVYYFSSVMDKLGRSLSLIGIGLVFLGGGWMLEQTRRRLLARISKEVL